MIYAANMDEDGFPSTTTGTPITRQVVRGSRQTEEAQVIPVCAKLEAEIAEHGRRRRRRCSWTDLGIAEQSGLDRLIQASYTLLGLISYLTCRRG